MPRRLTRSTMPPASTLACGIFLCRARAFHESVRHATKLWKNPNALTQRAHRRMHFFSRAEAAIFLTSRALPGAKKKLPKFAVRRASGRRLIGRERIENSRGWSLAGRLRGTALVFCGSVRRCRRWPFLARGAHARRMSGAPCHVPAVVCCEAGSAVRSTVARRD